MTTPTTPEPAATGEWAKWLKPDYIKLHAGEMSAQELRTVQAVVKAMLAARPQSEDSPAPEKHSGHASACSGCKTTVASEAVVAAWIDNSGHPKHLSYLQGVKERELYGPLRPLYEHPPV
jgi:hypothetical protein